jgi:imidazolonepropionase-like amidohydrolase
LGATWIALHDTQKFTPDELAAIRDEASRTGTGIASGGDPIEEAEAGLAAGVDAIDHFDGSLDPARAEGFINRLEHSGTYLIAPMGFFTRYNTYRREPALVERDGWVARRFDTQPVGNALVEHTRRCFESPPPSEQNLVDGYDTRRALFRRLLASKVKMVVGTDSGSQGNFHGDAIWWELRAWHESGAPVSQMLAAATSIPAKMLRLPDRGSLRPAARGDFIIYDGALEKGELELAKVRTVAKAGVLFVNNGEWVGPTEPGTALRGR